MKTLVCIKPGLLAYKEAPKPFLKKDHALLKIKQVGICGTDLHAFEGTQPFFNYPRILGHELVAEIEDADGINFKKGGITTVIPYFNCGLCIACRKGKPNCCTAINVCGVHTDGGMAEYLLVPSYSLLQNDRLTPDELTLLEPLAIGAHAVNRANMQQGEFVLVIGAGPIGLGTMGFAKIAGARVIAMDVNEARLSFCKEKINVDHAINAFMEDVTEKLKEITHGDMPTVVIDATGNLKAINNAFRYLAHGARYVLVGLQKEEICFSHSEFHKREASLMSSRNATRKDFEHVVSSIEKGLVKPSTFITHRVKFHQVIDNFESWLDPDSGVIKVIVEMD
jgi:2-desacetyl-2-hydroxyethyl bacteriochlorophyllide A dehydrogenase